MIDLKDISRLKYKMRLTFFCQVFLNLFILGSAYNIDYILSAEGNITGNYGEYMQFHGAMDESNIISVNTILSDCIEQCSNNSNCTGYLEYEMGGNTFYNELRDTSEMEYTSLNSRSYSKIVHFEQTGNYSIDGITLYTLGDSLYHNTNTTLYIDLNHNGRLDLGEPNTTTNRYFDFDGLTPGNYLLREDYSHGCYGLFPDIYGYTVPSLNNNRNIINNIGYIDMINNYRNSRGSIVGGVVENGVRVEGNLLNLLNLVDYNNDTYISFMGEDRVIVGFSNSTIMDGEGFDIEFILQGITSNIYAQVSVSTKNELDLQFLGILNESNTRFDLSSINYTYPVSHIHLRFFSGHDDDNEDEYINIASIIGDHVLDYIPYNAVYINIPSNSSVAFIRDCNYRYDCEEFCDFTMYSWDDFLSCNTGCILSEMDSTCPCNTIEPNSSTFVYDNPLYGNEYPTTFQIDKCYDGCEYNINRIVYPNFTYARNRVGLESDMIDNDIICETSECLRWSVNECNDMNCTSFSIDKSTGHNLNYYDSHTYVWENNSAFFVRNDVLRQYGYTDMDYITFSPTQFPSISPTFRPSLHPTLRPSIGPTLRPSLNPTLRPSNGPTYGPTMRPSQGPTYNPSNHPTYEPSFMPTNGPSFMPSNGPSFMPSNGPSFMPSNGPSFMPSNGPSFMPTNGPSDSPTIGPNLNRTFSPTGTLIGLQSDNHDNNEYTPKILLYAISGGIVLILIILVFTILHKRKHTRLQKRLTINRDYDRPSFTNPLYDVPVDTGIREGFLNDYDGNQSTNL